MFKTNELLNATGGKLIGGSAAVNIKGISIDSRTIKEGQAFIAIKGNNFNGHNFISEAVSKGARAVIAQHPATRNLPENIAFIQVSNTTKALGDIARFNRQRFAIPVIAISGSNGKTTTKEMIAGILSGKFKVLKNEGTKNNQIGLALTLLNLNADYDMAVLELGTNHPGEIEYLARTCLPNIGVITNIGPAHLEYFGDLGGVFKEKWALMRNLIKPCLGILNADDAMLRKNLFKDALCPFTLGFGIKKRGDFFASQIKFSKKLEFWANLKYKFTLATLGYYNIYNALAAIAVGRIFGIKYKDMAERLANFDFPQGRLKFINLDGLKFIDDTYNSNPSSLKQALDTLDNYRARGKKIFVMGDMLELGESKELLHRRVGEKIKKRCDIFIAVGNLAKIAAEAAIASGFDIKNIFTCQCSSQARAILFNRLSLKKEDIVLVKGSRAMKMEEVFKV